MIRYTIYNILNYEHGDLRHPYRGRERERERSFVPPAAVKNYDEGDSKDKIA